MNREQPLSYKLYFWPIYTEVVRLIGYAGCRYRELWERLKPVSNRFGQREVEAATAHLLTYEGQFTCNPKPLAEVMLRSEVRKLAWQLLGPPPEHPEFTHFHQPEAWVPPWARPKPAKEKPKEPPKENLEMLFEHQLRDRLRSAHEQLSTVSPRSKVGKQKKAEITALRNELKRRGMDPTKVEEEVLGKK